MLNVENLSVEVDGKRILNDVNLFIGEGETHALFGPNGSGKTSLLFTMAGVPKYKVKSGKIIFKGKDITDAPMDERAKLGIGIMFQHPPVLRGVKLKDRAGEEAQPRELFIQGRQPGLFGRRNKALGAITIIGAKSGPGIAG